MGLPLKSLACFIAVLTTATALVGCGTTGKDGEVAAALLATSQVTSRAFEASVSLQPTKASTENSGVGMDMKLSGAIDTSDQAKPKMAIKLSASGSETSIIVPGDGKVYMTTGGSAHSIPMPPQKQANSTIDPNKIYAALGSAVSGFKPSPPLTNHAGQSVRTVSATIDKSKLCGPVLDAFGEALTKASGVGGAQFGAGSNPASGAGGTDVLKGFCKSMLQGDPRVWLGIDGGKVTDVVLRANVKLPFAGEMKLDVAYHEYNQGGQQTGFEAPAGATPLTSPSQLPAA